MSLPENIPPKRYFSQRHLSKKLFVSIKQVFSLSEILIDGVLQRSALEPIFLLYVNDCRAQSETGFYLDADNTLKILRKF